MSALGPQLLALGLTALGATPGQWPDWDRYADHFVSAEGRVIDHGAAAITTSEGQAYGLFFALVANDRVRFNRLLRWTQDNLAQGDLGRHLPAWKWGRDAQGHWRVLDPNSATDADLWMAYSLFEASRLWGQPSYGRLARQLTARIVRQEVAVLPGLGPTLLPAPVGFELARRELWRLNPSYLPPQLLRRFAASRVPGPWHELLSSAVRIWKEGSFHGFHPDWVSYRAGSGFRTDPVTGSIGGYDAIRVPLWLALLHPDDPLKGELLSVSGGLFRDYLASGLVPERVDVSTGEGSGIAPVGFLAVMLAEAFARNDREAVKRLEDALEASRVGGLYGLYGQPPAYYDQNLILFGRGFLHGRFRFLADGSLEPSWGR